MVKNQSPILAMQDRILQIRVLASLGHAEALQGGLPPSKWPYFGGL